MTPEQRSSIENGIWLCQTCSKIIDSDEKKYTVEVLKDWKSKAESRAEIGLIKQINEITDVKKERIVEEKEKDVIEVLNIHKNSQWSSIQYEEYLKKFEGLNDYIYCKDFTNFFKKDFIFDAGMAAGILYETSNRDDGCDGFNACLGGLNDFEEFIKEL